MSAKQKILKLTLSHLSLHASYRQVHPMHWVSKTCIITHTLCKRKKLKCKNYNYSKILGILNHYQSKRIWQFKVLRHLFMTSHSSKEWTIRRITTIMLTAVEIRFTEALQLLRGYHSIIFCDDKKWKVCFNAISMS